MSEQSPKSGKRPVEEKPVAKFSYDFGEFSLEQNQLTISPALKKEIESQGFEARWLDKATYIKNQGHYRGWQAYKRLPTSFDTITIKENLEGKSPEGYVQSGTAILGVRPKEFGEKHRAKLKQKADAMSNASLAKKQAAELKEEIRSFQGSERVVEGYEDK